MPETKPAVHVNGLLIFVVLVGAMTASRGLVAGETNEIVAVGPKSRVVLVRDPTAVKGFEVDPAKVRAMVVLGIKTLTGREDEAAAWREFVSSNDIVGIKVSTQWAPLLATHRPLVVAIADGLRAAGVPATNIIVWARHDDKLRTVGYAAGEDGKSYRVVTNATDIAWDAETYYESRSVGKLIWGDLFYGQEDAVLSTRSHLPRVLTRTITKLINVPVLKDNDACGLAGCLYNVSLNAIDNGRRFEEPGQVGDPAIADICASPHVRRKLVLNVMDALVGGYAGGVTFKPQYSWNYGGLYFSRDPVAVDMLAVGLLDAKQRETQVPRSGPNAIHILTAARVGLGQASSNGIEVIEVTP